MARKPFERSLPRLGKLFPGFRGFPKEAHRLKLATEHMRTVARRLRKARNQAFYSMREAAEFWSVPLRTMALAYQQLENEGLIVRVRGSRTVLVGKAIHSQHPARSIVSVPFHLSSIISSHFTRSFCDRISEELWKHHFVANLILCTDSEYSSSALADRLWHQSDMVIWLFSNSEMKETILTLRDHGVSNVLLRPIEDPFLPANYLMDWTSVYRKAILDWKADGIRHVIVVKPSKPCFQKIVASFLQILRDLDFTYTMADDNPFALRDKVEQQLKNKKKARIGSVILEHDLSYRFCNDQPVLMAKLTTQCRFLFGRGSVYAPYFSNRDFQADVIGFVGDEVAVQVAADLGRRSGIEAPAPLLPRWTPRVKLGEAFI